VYVPKTRLTYLENAYKILDDDPVIIVEFILPQFETLVGSNLVNCNPVCKHEPQHVISGVSVHHNIMRDEPFLEMQLTTDAVPSRESNHR
jgi:hypothetical protein